MKNKIIVIPEKRLSAIIQEAVNLQVRKVLSEFNFQKPEFADLPEFLTRKQAAKMLSISIGTLDSWTKEGSLTKYRKGKIVRYRKSEILESFKTLQGRKYSRIERKEVRDAK